MTASQAFLDAIMVRRSHYSLSPSSPISDGQIKAIIEKCVLHTPTSFNLQTGHCILITGAKENERLWSLVKKEFLGTLAAAPPPVVKTMSDKLDGYAKGYGTVLFFEDQAPIDVISEKMAQLKPFFGPWSENSAGMLQFAVWTALSNEGLGCSLQHHGSMTPDLNALLAKQYGFPTTWRNTAIMPFGTPVGPPGQGGEKTFQPIEGRLLTFSS